MHTHKICTLSLSYCHPFYTLYWVWSLSQFCCRCCCSRDDAVSQAENLSAPEEVISIPCTGTVHADGGGHSSDRQFPWRPRSQGGLTGGWGILWRAVFVIWALVKSRRGTLMLSMTVVVVVGVRAGGFFLFFEYVHPEVFAYLSAYFSPLFFLCLSDFSIIFFIYFIYRYRVYYKYRGKKINCELSFLLGKVLQLWACWSLFLPCVHCPLLQIHNFCVYVLQYWEARGVGDTF